MIEREFQQAGRDVRTSRNDRDVLFRERLGDEGGNEISSRRCLFRRFHHRTVAGCNRGNEGIHHQAKRVVPRRDDEHRTARLDHQPRTRPREQKGCVNAAAAHPPREMTDRHVDLLKHMMDLSRLRLERRTAQIGADRVDNVLVTSLNGPTKPAQ